MFCFQILQNFCVLTLVWLWIFHFCWLIRLKCKTKRQERVISLSASFICRFYWTCRVFANICSRLILEVEMLNFKSRKTIHFLYYHKSLSLSFSLYSLSLSFFLFLSLSLSLSLTHTHTHTFSLSFTFSRYLCLSLTFSLSHTQSLSLTLSLSLTHIQIKLKWKPLNVIYSVQR